MKETNPFYASSAWKRARQLALQRDGGMCQDCMDRLRSGTITKPRRAAMVHHMQPIEDFPELALDIDNLRSLCNACHAARHPEKGGVRKADQNLATMQMRMRVIKV